MLGTAIPLSGGSADIGPYMKNGARFAIDEINAKGGVLGRKLKLRAEDAACDPKTAVAAGAAASAADGSARKVDPRGLPVFRPDRPWLYPAASLRASGRPPGPNARKSSGRQRPGR
ncbi:ABC transporter substrate-binding protein [Streptomyces globisporus]|uniref:ABC transporter substrate-binding protein n=1 Tax=Streptomyces globisporus TaxID=1908 RepID=UPI0004C9E500|nr:ABC transporter substrate-binding protein [Streptomyces globisporus]